MSLVGKVYLPIGVVQGAEEVAGEGADHGWECQDEGIIAVVNGGAGYGFGHNLLNEQFILVREDQAEAAREILADFDSEAEFAWDEEFEPQG